MHKSFVVRAQSPHLSDISRMHARVLCDENWPVIDNSLFLILDVLLHFELLLLFIRQSLVLFFTLFAIICLPVVVLDLDEYFILFKYA